MLITGIIALVSVVFISILAIGLQIDQKKIPAARAALPWVPTIAVSTRLSTF